MDKVITFLKEVNVELKRVNWLTKNEALKYTFIVIGVSLVFALFYSVLDLIFSGLINKVV